MPALYKLTDAYAQLQQLAEDGEDFAAVLATIDGDDLEVKADRCIRVLRNLEADAASAKVEAKRIADRAKSLAKESDRLRAYILACMDGSSIERIKGPLFTLSACDGPEAMELVDPDAVADEYTTTVIAPSKSLAKDHYKETGEIPRGFDVVRRRQLRVR